MLISHRKKFIYTKTNKTAGTSVEAYFEPFCLPEGTDRAVTHSRTATECKEGIIGYRGGFHYGQKWYNHMPASRIKHLVGDFIWNDYFKFCVVRNPYDKMVSLFYHLKKDYERSTAREAIRNGVKYVIGKRGTVYWPTRGTDVEQFRRWVRRGGMLIDRNKYVIEGQPCLDYYIKYENLTEDVRSVCDRLSMPFDPTRLPEYNASRRERSITLSEFYDQRTKETVGKIFDFELKHFGYAFPDSPQEGSTETP